MDKILVFLVAPGLYCTQIKLYSFELEDEKNIDANNICCNPLFPVNQRSWLLHFLLLSATVAMNNNSYGNFIAYITSESQWGF